MSTTVAVASAPFIPRPLTTTPAQSTSTSTTNMPSSSSHPSPNPSSAPPTRPRMNRGNSHLRRTGPGALVIPVPPTLANSPHLQSPNSIFRRAHAGPRASPGAEEERWLRDTVPIGVGVGAVMSAGEGRSGGGRYEEGGDGRTRASSVSSVALGRHSLSVPNSATSTRSPPPPTPVMPPRSSAYTYPQRERG